MGFKDIDIKGFSEKGSWYKGNLHSHTTNSDGVLAPQESAEMFRGAGYSFLCLSDHDRYSDYRSELNRKDFIIIPGYEASAVCVTDTPEPRAIETHHVNAILGTSAMQAAAAEKLPAHLERLPKRVCVGKWNGAKVLASMIEKMTRRGFIAMYNHPLWSRVHEEEFIGVPGYFAVEVYNYCSVNESGIGEDTLHWDMMLRAGHRVFATATDDNHNLGLFDDALGGWITVKSESLTHDDIISNIIAGNYYSSSGPEIFGWGVKDGVAYVECGDAARVNFIVGGFVGDGATVIAKNGTLRSAEYKLKGSESYVRAEVVDGNGKTAWTNAIFLDINK